MSEIKKNTIKNSDSSMEEVKKNIGMESNEEDVWSIKRGPKEPITKTEK